MLPTSVPDLPAGADYCGVMSGMDILRKERMEDPEAYKRLRERSEPSGTLPVEPAERKPDEPAEPSAPEAAELPPPQRQR